MNISLPEGLKAFVDERVTVAGYGTSSEYLRDLIRRDQDRLYLRTLLAEGASAPLMGEVDEKYFSDLRAQVKQRLTEMHK